MPANNSIKHIDLNCDMGEGIGNEEALMPFISSANIACGFHAGDKEEMKKMVSLCLQYSVAIGAHPSFPDRENFGRKEMHLPAGKIYGMISEQLHLINDITVAAGAKMHHVKLHGALYNMAARDAVLARAVAIAVKDFDDRLFYYGLSCSVMLDEAMHIGLKVVHEVFADRTYQPGGQLTPRSDASALITDADIALKQVRQMILEKEVTTISGKKISIKADTICLHGDAAGAVTFAKKLNNSLTKSGTQIQTL